MALDRDAALNGLARVVQVIAEERGLRQWFLALAQRSEVERRNEILWMTERLQTEGKDENLVGTFRLLADARVFDAAVLALRESDTDM